jgi:hypothetical protein
MHLRVGARAMLIIFWYKYCRNIGKSCSNVETEIIIV